MLFFLFISAVSALNAAQRYRGSKPNVIIMFADGAEHSQQRKRAPVPCRPTTTLFFITTPPLPPLRADYGWGDVGHNNPDVKETVAIDALAAGGITLKDMHTYPLCTPSRAQLLTGRLPPRTGVTTNFAPESLFGLAAEEHTIASLLKPAGYDTAQLGKWHLGTHPGYHPTWRGFDQSLTVPYSVDMGCLGPSGGPIYNLPAESPCPTGPNNSPKASGASALALYNSTKQCGDPSAASCNAQIVQQPLSEDFLDRNYKACVAHPQPAKPRAAPEAAP